MSQIEFISLIIIIIIILIFFYYLYILNQKNNNESFQNKICYGNQFCENQDLCLSQRCVKCGLKAPCTKDNDCNPFESCMSDGCCAKSKYTKIL